MSFEKDALHFQLLEGRFALSSVNGMGISSKKSLFTFDIERYPIFGIEVNEYGVSCETVCMERTGRIYGAHANTVFEYNPIKRQKKVVVKYPEG
jgi:hypothetical protein